MHKQTRFSNCWAKAVPLLIFSFFAMPASAIVITSVSINGVQLVSEASSLAFGLPSNLMIASNNGSFLFNFSLVSDPSQNPDETIFGDSFTVSFFANAGSELQAPDNFGSLTYYLGNIPKIPAFEMFTRQLGMTGTFDGGLSFHMSNSAADYYSPFSGYESNPVFHFTLINLPGQIPTPTAVTQTTSTTTTTTPQGGSTHTPQGTHVPQSTLSLPDPGPAVMGTTPEPGTFGLMIAGVLLLAGRVRGTNRG